MKENQCIFSINLLIFEHFVDRNKLIALDAIMNGIIIGYFFLKTVRFDIFSF